MSRGRRRSMFFRPPSGGSIPVEKVAMAIKVDDCVDFGSGRYERVTWTNFDGFGVVAFMTDVRPEGFEVEAIQIVQRLGV